MSIRLQTHYMDDAVFHLDAVIETARERLANVDFDTIVGTGFSGGIVIPSLALSLGKAFTLVRKDTDDSHHGRGRLLGELGERWIFVDDFISSGSTRFKVMNKIANEAARRNHDTQYVGQYMYVNHSEQGPQFEPVGSDKCGYMY